MEYRYELSDIVDWDIDKYEGKFVFATHDNIEEDWGPFDVYVFIDSFDWQPYDPDDPDGDYDSWYLDDYKISKIEFCPEGEGEVSEEKFKEIVGISEENLEYLKEMVDYELGERMSAWIDRFGPQAKVDNN